MDVRTQLELHYTQQRERLFAILVATDHLSLPALDLMVASFRNVTDLTDLGPHCWAIMPKSEAFLTCIAAFGWDRGVKEFEAASTVRDVDKINSLVITRDRFISFWYDGSDDKFSFYAAWKLIDQLWEVWDVVPVRLHGFVSPAISETQLQARLAQPGSFLLRFSSRGGLAVDLVRHNRVEKMHWRAGELASAPAFKKKLYENKDLVAVVDASRPGTPTLEKEKAFPLQPRDRGYVTHAGQPQNPPTDNPYEVVGGDGYMVPRRAMSASGEDGYENVTPDGRVLSMSAFIPMSGGSFSGSLYSNDVVDI